MSKIYDILEPILADLDACEEPARQIALAADHGCDRIDLPRELSAPVFAMARVCATLRPVLDQCNEIGTELDERNAQLDATRNAIAAECIEHSELNGHIDLAEQCRDFIAHEIEVRVVGDPSGRLGEFVESLRVVIDQCDRQRRRANWYESAYTAGKQKLIESATDRALSRARAAAQVYAERVEALGLAADDNDPLVMATAGPLGAAQADLYAALGLLQRSKTGSVVVRPPAETVEQLRAERDAARMLADVRGRERDELRDRVAKLEALRAVAWNERDLEDDHRNKDRS